MMEVPTEHMDLLATFILADHQAARASGIIGIGLQFLSREDRVLNIVNADLFSSSFLLRVLREFEFVLANFGPSNV